MKRAKQVLAMLLSLALLLGMCGLAEEPVEAAEVAEPIEELIEETPAEEAEAPVEEELPEEEAPAEEPEEAPIEEAPVEESIELEPVNADGDFIIVGGELQGYLGEDGDITIPDGVTSIASNVFYFSSKLTSVRIPSSVTYIGDKAFNACSFLTSVYIEDGSLSVGSEVFANSQKLTTVHLGEGMTSIGKSMFSGCIKLASVNIPKSVTRIEDSAFHYCPVLTGIEIPEKLEYLGDHAFYGCDAIKSITLPEDLTSISDNAFDSCSGLEEINLPKALVYIGHDAFYGCKLIKSFVIPEGVTSIGDSAFAHCDALTSIKISGSVKTLGGYVFDYDKNLSTVDIPEGVTTIGPYAFRGFTEQQTIYLPKSLTEFDENTFDDPWEQFTATVYVYKNSPAHKFCKEHDNIINLKLRDGEPPVTDATVSLPVGSIILSQTESQTIKPTTEGLKKNKKESYTFISSDPSVAMVSKGGGKITAKNPGTATITATGKTSGASASCTVTVVAAPSEIEFTAKPESDVLNKGAEFQLVAGIKPLDSAPQEVTWKSSKPKIASVDKNSGLVKALKEGKTTITATAGHKNLKGKSVTQKFTLTVVDPTRPTAIKIDPEMPTVLEMTDGQQVAMQLKHVLEPADTAQSEVTWSIPKKAHKKLASVTPQGQLTAKQAGKVQLKVTAKTKSAAGKTLSATVEITITDPTIPTSVTIAEADGTQIKKGEKLTLHAICAPETAEKAELEWSSSNKKVAKVDKLTGEITAVKPGKAKITATAKKGGQKASITVQVIQ